MSNKTCFVIMSIGDQTHGTSVVASSELKSKYDDLIKEAIKKARPNTDVVRADEVSLQGTITTDIVTRLMHSTYVVADVTFPNPNVFYELGLRHSCKPGTVIIKDKSGPKIPFDIAHLRYIEYENTTTGLKSLSKQLTSVFDHIDREPSRPDNHFLEIAKLTGYQYPSYKPEEAPAEMQVLMGLMESPGLLDIFRRQSNGEEINQIDLMQAVLSSPKVAEPFLKAMIQSGELSIFDKKKLE